MSVERFAFYVRRGEIKNRESGELSECRGGQERTTNRTNFHEYCFLGGNVGRAKTLSVLRYATDSKFVRLERFVFFVNVLGGAGVQKSGSAGARLGGVSWGRAVSE